jgi:hypothetical protein
MQHRALDSPGCPFVSVIVFDIDRCCGSIFLTDAAFCDSKMPLEQRGLRVICAPIPMTSLTDDATALSQALDRTNGPVVLVGHAYSGVVIAAVREDRVGRIRRYSPPEERNPHR